MPGDEIDYSFDDRVAVRYDEVRAHPPEVSKQIGESIVRQTGPGTTLLEPGVGTGRIALPVIAAGGNVVGVDLSSQMLSALSSAADESDQLELVRCDISRLPFKPQSFDGVLCVHVLHLIDDWKGLLHQLLDALKPGGVVLLGRDWIDPESFAGQIRNEFRMAVVELSETIASPPGARAFVNELIEQGAKPEEGGAEITATEWETELTPRHLLDEIRTKDDAESWVLPDDLLARVMERLDAFAAEAWPDIDSPLPVKRRFVYSLFRKAA